MALKCNQICGERSSSHIIIWSGLSTSMIYNFEYAKKTMDSEFAWFKLLAMVLHPYMVMKYAISFPRKLTRNGSAWPSSPSPMQLVVFVSLTSVFVSECYRIVHTTRQLGCSRWAVIKFQGESSGKSFTVDCQHSCAQKKVNQKKKTKKLHAMKNCITLLWFSHF